MNWIKLLFFSIFFFAFFNVPIDCQVKKRPKGTKHSSRREIEKRKREGELQKQTDTPYSPVQSSSVARRNDRDDFIWKAETGNTIYEKAGNVSLFEPSRYGLKDGIELQSYLPLDYWVPNILFKKRWHDKDWYISSRHGIYSATSGFKYSQRRQIGSFVDSTSQIPFLLSLKNEIIFSKPFVQSYSCTPNQPLWILNFGGGVDFGFPFGKNDLTEIDKHFLANRSPALIGKGYQAYIFIGGLAQINQSMIVDVSMRYFHGTFSGKNALEQKTWLEIFITRNVSGAIGYDLSIAGYNNTSTVGIMPMIDISWYFGQKMGKQKGLFGKKMQ